MSVVESPAKQSIAFTGVSQAQPSKVWHLLCLRSLSKQSIGFTTISKAQPRKVWHDFGFRRLSPAQNEMYVVFQSSAEEILHSLCFQGQIQLARLSGSGLRERNYIECVHVANKKTHMFICIYIPRDAKKLALPGPRYSEEWRGLPTRPEWAWAEASRSGCSGYQTGSLASQMAFGRLRRP